MQKAPFAGAEIGAFVFSLDERRIMLPPSLQPHPLFSRERKRTGARERERCNHLRPSRAESNGAIIRTFANQLGERCENYRRETLSRLSCPLGTALEETGRLRALNSCGPHREERLSRDPGTGARARAHGCETHAACVYTTVKSAFHVSLAGGFLVSLR